MNERDKSVGLNFEIPKEAAHVAESLRKEGIQADVVDLSGSAGISSSSSGAKSRLFLRPEHTNRANELFRELRIYQYLNGWGGSHPGYNTPLVHFTREVNKLRLLHKTHIWSWLVLVVLIAIIKVLEGFYSLPVPKVLGWFAALTFIVGFLSVFAAGWSTCPRCKKPFHHHWILFTVFETQCLGCGFHLWNDDGI